MVESWEDFMIKLDTERSNLKKFISNFSNRDEFVNLWYPKGCWIIDKGNSNFWNKMISNITLEKSEISDLICRKGVFPCDGLIIDHFDSSREIKAKPIRLHTIDLLYSGDNWIDRDNCIWNVESEEYINENTIWRCYLIKDKWIAKERRYDKFRANPNNIAKTIEKLAKMSWTRSYYHKTEDKKNISNFIYFLRKQQNYLKNFINLIPIKMGKNWLDLGCGNGKLIRLISNNHPNIYYGLDNDSTCLSKLETIKLRNYWINLINVDLNNNWNSEETISGKKFDYIVANFSITYYYSDNFWNQLNDYSIKGSYLICNFLNNKSKDGYNNDGCLVETKDGETQLFFPWCHQEKVKEIFIEDIKFKSDLKKFGWKVYQQSVPPGEELDSYYSWYILTRI